MGEKMIKVDRTAALMLILLSMFVVTSSLRLVTASGPVYIRADGSVDPPGSPLQRNGDLYTLSGNITSDSDGIVIEKGNIIIDGNGYTVKGGPDGKAFYVYGIDNVTVRNTRTEGFSYGIYLESTSRNIIYGNNLTGSTYDGIGLFDSIDNIISFNHMKENGWSGVNLYFSSGNNISGNSITNNYYGISMYSSENSSIFHNNFINNTDQISSDASPNVWDEGYPSGGNYWNDYTGADLYRGPYQNETGSDGIGDTPYSLYGSDADHYPLMKPYAGPHDMGIKAFISKTVVAENYSTTVSINVTIINYGEQAETFNFTLQTNTTIQEQTLTLVSRNSTTLTFSWNTISFPKGNYIINAYASPVPGETDTTDNTYIGWIVITIPGDVDGNGKVDMKDIGWICKAYGSTPGHPKWSPNADINDDGKVDMKDIGYACMHYGQHYP